MRAEVTAQMARDYVRDAIVNLRGCYHPEDPFFGITYSDVRVSYASKKKTKP